MKREDIPPSHANLMPGEQSRESLRQYKPVVYVDGRLIEVRHFVDAVRW